MKTVTLYTKQGCHLCEQALDVLDQLRRRHPFALTIVDILDDPAAYDRYKHDVPVVMLEGREVARHRVTAAQLISHLSGPT
jgi:glutaredoxin